MHIIVMEGVSNVTKLFHILSILWFSFHWEISKNSSKMRNLHVFSEHTSYMNVTRRPIQVHSFTTRI